MPVGGERRVNAVSLDELSRRWQAVREQMAAQRIDALILQNSSDWVGGYIRWFTNRPATNGYASSVVFPRQGGMSLIEQGPFGHVRVADESELKHTGIGRTLTTPSYPSVGYTGHYDADLAVSELRLLGAKRVGLVAPAAMYYSFGARCRESLADLDVVDATDMVDKLKAIKSAEERGLIRQVAAMQDEVMTRVRAFIRPGLKDFEIAAYAQYVAQQLGSEQGIYLGSSAPLGERAGFQARHGQGRELEAGDIFSLLVENNGAGGYYTELSRIFVLGRASGQLREAHAAVIEAQRQALQMLKPGVACRDIFTRHNAWLAANRMPVERRLSIHGMGYDMVERPLIRADEDMLIEEHMAIVCHPGWASETMFVHNTDTYLVEADGPSACLHHTPKQIIEIV